MRRNVVAATVGIATIFIVFGAQRYSWYKEKEKEKLLSRLKEISTQKSDIENIKKTLETENEKLRSDLKTKEEHLKKTQRELEQRNENIRYQRGTFTDCNAWLKSCESHCTRNSSSPIPKHVHFISLNRPFTFLEWLAVVSARKKIKPDKITVYTDGKQDSCWWRRALPYIEHQLFHLPPGSVLVNGVIVRELSHMSDFLRESILYHYGGIYLDTDALSLNSFDDLLSNQVVLARQCSDRVGTGVIVAQKHNCFVCQYAHRGCKKYNGGWITHAVDTIDALVKEVDSEKEGLLVLSNFKGFHPLCWNTKGLHQMYMEDFDNFPLYNKSEIYVVHLYGRKARASIFPTTVNNIDWIQNNKSLAAIAIRESLPSEFSEHHLDTTACASLKLDD